MKKAWKSKLNKLELNEFNREKEMFSDPRFLDIGLVPEYIRRDQTDQMR